MTDIVIKKLSDDEYTELKIAYAESRYEHWKEFIIEAVRIWKKNQPNQ